MTCIIVAKSVDGYVVVSETRVMRGFEAINWSEIYNLWEKHPIVITGACTAALLDKFKTRIYNLNFGTTTHKPKAENLVKNVVTDIYMRYSDRLRDNYKFDAIIMGLKEFYKGEAYILRVHDNGITEDVKKYAIIGLGSPHVAALYSLLYE